MKPAGIEELKKRLLTIQALETARCVEEGVVTHAEDGDIGSIFGWGFPPYTGGTLSYIDTIGIGISSRNVTAWQQPMATVSKCQPGCATGLTKNSHFTDRRTRLQEPG